jgi:hypothetical protein
MRHNARPSVHAAASPAQQEQPAVNFFKNSLDEVADVCSILTVGLSIFISLRVKKSVDLLSGMATAISEFDADSPRRGHGAKFM